MIWALSRFYCTDETMIPLCERIAWTLKEKVTTILKASTLFGLPLTVVEMKTAAAKKMLELWRESYMATRDEIEKVGKTNRWEFDKVILFADTDYIAKVCGDLNEIAVVSTYIFIELIKIMVEVMPF